LYIKHGGVGREQRVGAEPQLLAQKWQQERATLVQ
jgi:hypothetical protein